MTRVSLSRLPGGRVLVVEGGSTQEVAEVDLPAYVREREVDGPRWVWDDTARWYPSLLAAGVRVERCHDLRLCHHLLRRAPAVDVQLLEGDESQHWDRFGPSTPSDPALFSVDDTTERLRADLEDARQLATVAASVEAGRLGLLLAAESSGALIAAEMTYAGVPWRSDVHQALLSELLGPRPPRGARPQKLEALVAEVRDAFDAPVLNPDSRPELLAALRRAGLDVADTRASTLRRLEHPGIASLLRYKQLAHLFSTNGWAWIDQWVSGGRFRPSYQPAGSTTGRWSSNGGGALSFPVQVRSAAVADDGWVFVVADVAQLEPRVLAGMSGDRALARSARGTDLYQGMVDDGAVTTRKDAKLGLLGAMYGATSGESGRMVAGLTRRYPDAFGLVEAAARAGERGQVVRTLLGRGSPDLMSSLGEAWDRDPDDPPADPDSQTRRRRAYGRFTRNFVVQGTGAEWALCWIADLRNRLWRLGGCSRGPRHLPAASRLLPPRRGRGAHSGRARRPGGRAGPRGGDNRSRPAVPRSVDRLPTQHLDRAVLRRRGQTWSSGRRTSGTARTFGAMTENPKDTPWEPPLSGSEVEHVLGALDRLRWTFRYKADELDAAGLDTRIGPSSLTLGGLLKHLATQEDFATAVKMDGEEMPAEWADNGWDDDDDWEFSSAAGDSPEELYARYDGAVARARERLRVRIQEGGLDQQVALAEKLGEPVSLRRIVYDLVEEYGRHTGQADLIREAVDGRVGEDPPARLAPDRDPPLVAG